MTAGLIGFSEPGALTQASPAIWKDCPKTLLNDLGLGFYVNKGFQGNDGSLPGLASDSDSGTTFTYKTGEETGVMTVTITNTDNNAAAVYTQPLGKIVKNSGNKVWAEVRVALGAVADQAVFFGLAEEAALDRDVIADNAGAVDTESVIGFLCETGDQDAYDIIYRKDNGTVVEVLADATNSARLTAAGLTAAAVGTGYRKLGLRFDGRTRLEFYVDGVLVITQTVDTTIDQSKAYGAILAIKTGTTTQRTLNVDLFAAAFQVRS